MSDPSFIIGGDASASERERMERLFEQAPSFMTLLEGPEHRFALANPAYVRLVGHRDVIGKTVAEALPEAVEQGFVDLLDQVYRTGEAFASTGAAYAMQATPGGPVDERFLDFVYQPVRDASGVVEGIFVEGYDVTERVHADVALRENGDRLRASEARLRELNADLERQVIERTQARGRTWQVSPDLLSVINAEGYFESTNPAWQEVLGWTSEELARAPWSEFVHPDDLESSYAGFDDLLQNKPVLKFENRYVTPNGDHRWLQWVAVPEGGKFYCSARDVTAEKAREAELAERTTERDRMWQTSPDLLVVLGFDGVFRRVNPAWTAILGYEEHELVGTRLDRLVHPDDIELTERALVNAAGGPLPTVENRYWHKDGSYRWISWITGMPQDGTIYATGRHITAEREQVRALASAEDQLRQAQKMEAVGQLTGGVAHDFNNLLTVIKSSTDLLKRPDLPEERRARYIAAISDTVDRASKLTGQLLAFARRQALRPEVFDVGRSVQAIGDMLGTITGSRVVVSIRLPGEICRVNADPSQFDTALVNMVVNARDAMDGEGQLTLTVQLVKAMPAIRSHAAVTGAFVAVSITDTGSGIAPEVVERIFEPFFTTKGVGQGTGLGLSQVFGFAKQSGGEITVESEVGRGSTFTLYLPRATEDASAVDHREPETLMDGHGTCVLVVEDNIDVGTFATQTLADLGYHTVLAGNAEEALAELAKDPHRFDVVFSDVVMPGMSGIELGQEIRRRHPDTPVVLTSGYSHVLAQNGTFGFELLHKPYSIEDLSRVLRKAAQWQHRKRMLGT